MALASRSLLWRSMLFRHVPRNTSGSNQRKTSESPGPPWATPGADVIEVKDEHWSRAAYGIWSSLPAFGHSVIQQTSTKRPSWATGTGTVSGFRIPIS